MDKKPLKTSASYYYSYFRLNKIVSLLLFTFLMTVGITSYIVIRPFLTKGQESVVSNASLRLPPSLTASLNSTLTLPLTLNTDTQTIYGVDTLLGFDTTKLQLVDIMLDATTSSTLKHFVPQTTSGLFDKAKVIQKANTDGLIQFSAVTFDNTQGTVTSPFNGNIILATLRFKALSLGATVVTVIAQPESSLDSNIVLALTPPLDALKRADQITNATITISNTTTLTPTPTQSGPTVTKIPTPSLTRTPTPSLTNTPTPTPIKSTPTFTPTPSISVGNGLIGTYFNTLDFNNQLFQRIDNTVNFNWGQNSPDATIASNTFSVRWTGFVLPERSGTYTFFVTADDGVRLWIKNTELIDKWNDHSAKEFSGKIVLTAGQKVPVRLEYYENRGQARVELRWLGPSLSKVIIPSANLSTE